MSRGTNRAPHISLLSPAVGTGNIGDHLIEMAIRRVLREDVVYHRFSIRRPLTEPEIDAINATECALLCGTNLYQHDWHSALTPEILAGFRVPVIPFGVGSSAARLEDRRVSEATREMIRALHSCCTIGSVRDPHSAEVVADVGVENVVLTGCPVLFWARGKSLPPIQPIRRRRIVLTVRNWLMHRWPDNVDHPVQIHLIRRLLETFPTDQLVFPIHEEFDARLVDLLRIPRRMVFRRRRAEDYTRLYGEQENVILAMRLHAGMLALAGAVPAVFVGHDTRTYSFCQMMGLDYVELFAETCAEECIARIQRILDGDVTPFAGMETKYQQLHNAMAKFLSANGLPGQCTIEANGSGSGG